MKKTLLKKQPNTMMRIKKPTLIALLLTVVFSLGIATTTTNDQGKYFEISKNIEIFVNLYKELNTHYVDELDPSGLMHTGIDAMLQSLDPYTNYITESQIETYRFATEGKYRGIGAQIEVMDDYITITEPYENSPAVRSGLKAGDQVIAIEGKSTKGKSPEEVNAILMGYPGTSIRLTIQRPGEPKELTIDLERGEVDVPNVPYYGMVSDDIGYISLTTFTRDAGKNVANAFKNLQRDNENLKGVIFDLRGNGGGFLHEAVNICNIFIPKNELVVSTKGKVTERDRSFKTMNEPLDTEIPLVVLINNRSASASEIVSGVIQDYDRGILLGQRSYGKGLVQNTMDIGYNNKLKLTTAKYYIPSGRCIQSVEYDNGEPVDIPDEERARFQTRNGRTVLDGGGVKPDMYVDPKTDEPVIQALLDQHLLFDYVTQYCQDKDSIPPVEDFRFTEWNGFLQFLKDRNFTYETNTEKELEDMMAAMEKEGIEVNTSLKELEAQIQADKENDLEENKQIIVDLLEKDIASRYYYQKGKIQIGLRNDQEIKEAVSLIDEPTRYGTILSPEED